MYGQIASFLDTLHLSYDEIVNKIPYSVLIVMQRDKLETVEKGEVKEEVPGREMMKRKIK